MSNNLSDTRHSLPEWEQFLKPQFNQVELLGEITITAAEAFQIARLLGQFIKGRRARGVQKTCQALRHNYPCVFAVCLVALGAHDDTSGDFWPDIVTALGGDFDTNWRRQFGLLFEEILAHHRLSLFPEMTEHAFRYVSLILLHGGIPNYSLKDYFERLLKPAVMRTWYAEMPAAELVDDWLRRSAAQQIDQPVRRFLKYGGQIALDFVERSRQMALDFLETGLVPPADEVGLPQRVVEEFHRWAVEAQALDPTQLRRRATTAPRLRPPRLWLDPWGEGLVADLPAEPISAADSQAEIEWRLEVAGQSQITVPLRLRRIGDNLLTQEAQSHLLNRPAASYALSLCFDGEPRRTWHFPGLGVDSPLLVVDPDTWQPLNFGQTLPARPLWLFYPATATLEFKAEARQTEDFSPWRWGWTEVQGQSWDLSRATQLTLRLAGLPPLTWLIQPDAAAQRPRLIEGDLLTASGLTEAAPLYIGTPPSLYLPLVGRVDPADELPRWRLQIRNRWGWPAEPSLDLTLSLSDLRHRLVQRTNAVELPLNLPELLGEAPFGGYSVRVRGPLGRDADLPFWVLPWLFVSGHEQLYLPDPASGSRPVVLEIETEARSWLECEAEALCSPVETVKVEAGVHVQRVVIAPDQVEANLIVVKPLDSGEEVRVPVCLPLRRLRWALVGLEEAQQRHWSGQLLQQPLDALDQAADPVLLVEVGELPETSADPGQRANWLKLVLADSEETEIKQQVLAKSHPRQQRSVWRFNLRAFLDTLRQESSPSFRFKLIGWLDGQEIDLPVLSVSRSTTVDQVAVTLTREAGTLVVQVTWQEPIRLRHRLLRIWSLWQPWRAPLKQAIPDEAEGELTFRVEDLDFLHGRYRLEFLVADPWVGPPPVPASPPELGPNVVTIDTVSASARLSQLKYQTSKYGPRFERDLETALLTAEIDPGQSTWLTFKQCLARLAEASVAQLLAFVDFVKSSGDQNALGVLSLKLFEPKFLHRVIQTYKVGQIQPEQFQAFLECRPKKERLPLHSCRLLLAVDNDQVRLHALQQLVARDQPEAIPEMLAWLKAGRLSEADALDLLHDKVERAVGQLEPNLDDPIALRLVEQLAPDRSPVIKVGSWVRTPAGWGQITQIEDIETGAELQRFLKHQTSLRLQVILRPGYDAERVILEILADRTYLHFEDNRDRFQCTKEQNCFFITKDQGLLTNEHNKLAHHGLRPSFSIWRSDKPLCTLATLTYRARSPREVLI